ncbi:hypothetical protein KXV31_004670, partial [Aspergillus fumigatus]
PSDYWEEFLKADVENMLQTKRKRHQRVRSEGTAIMTPVEKQLRKWSNLLRIGKRLKVTIAFNYRQDDDGTPGRGDKRSRVSATRRMLAEREAQIDAEEERTGRPSSWNLVYGLMRCKVRSCPLKSEWCWEDPTDKKHYKLRAPHLGRLVDYVDDGGNLESHDDVPDDIRRDLVLESQAGKKSRKADDAPATGVPYTPISINVLPAQTTGVSVVAEPPARRSSPDQHPVIPGPREEAVRKYCRWLESRATDEAYKADFRRICKRGERREVEEKIPRYPALVCFVIEQAASQNGRIISSRLSSAGYILLAVMDEYVFDVQGDVVLCLSCSNNRDNEGRTTREQEEHYDYLRSIQLKVSSAVLSSCSRVFRALLNNERLMESRTLVANGSVEIPLPDDNPELFLIVIAIIYQRHDQVPTNMDSTTLARLATLVDKYEFHQSVRQQALKWVDKLESEIPSTLNNDTIIWLWISLVFRLRTLFRKLTAISQKEATGPISTPFMDDICLPARLINAIERRRLDALSRLQSLFVAKIADQDDENYGLSRSSNPEGVYWYKVTRPLRAFRLGFLMLQAYEAGIPCHGTGFTSQRHRFDGL